MWAWERASAHLSAFADTAALATTRLNSPHETQMDARRKMVVDGAFNFHRRGGRGCLGAGGYAATVGQTDAIEVKGK